MTAKKTQCQNQYVTLQVHQISSPQLLTYIVHCIGEDEPKLQGVLKPQIWRIYSSTLSIGYTEVAFWCPENLQGSGQSQASMTVQSTHNPNTW